MKTAIALSVPVGFTTAMLPAVIIAVSAAVGQAQPPVEISIQDRLPYGQPPLDYLGPKTDNPLSRLLAADKDFASGWPADPHSGYLKPLLKALNVPVASQLLVFSRTALNPRLVSPQTPRAVYFNDSVAVGWVPQAASIEITAMDPIKGAVFYTLSQNAQAKPLAARETRCLTCHAGGLTMQVPGLMLRSLMTDRRGKPLEGFSDVSHRMPLRQRWGGWYVTGQAGRTNHLGNIIGREAIARQRTNPLAVSNQAGLPDDVATHWYPAVHSDLVAHLVLDHQVRGQNLMIRAGYEARLGRRSDVEDRLFRYLLFLDEWHWSEPVSGTSGYQRWFSKQGPRSETGRSLRDFDLQTRLFRHRLSYLVYTPLFAGLPQPVLARLGRRWWEFLSDPRPEVEGISRAERQQILDILRSSRAALPRAAFPQLWKSE